MKITHNKSVVRRHILFLPLAASVIITQSLIATADTTQSTPSQSQAPGQHRVLREGGDMSFPFDIYRGDIRFQCEVNGHKVHMLLDDGYMWDQLLFWGGPQADSLGFKHEGSVEIGDNSDTVANLTSATASGITVRFPNVEFTDQSAVITPSSSGTATMWSGSVGQISAMLFKHFVVSVNFDSMRITLIEPEGFEYQGDGVEVAWKPLGFGPWGIPATLGLADGREISLKLLMDLGYNGVLQISPNRENDISAPDKALPVSLGMNIQGVRIQGSISRLPRIAIGGYEIRNMLVTHVSTESSKETPAEAMIGLELLSRFNLIFDYTRQRLFVKPNSRFALGFEHNMSGMSLRKSRDGFLEIVRLYDVSPAGEAGLQIGDVIKSIDGKSAAGIDLFDLDPLLKREGAIIKLTVARDNRTWEVSLALRRLI